MHEPQGAQFADLPLVDGGLEAEVELVEGLQVRQMRQLQPGLEIALPPRIGFGVHHFEQEIGIGRFFLRSAFPAMPSSRASMAVRLSVASVVRSCSIGVIAHLPQPRCHKPPKVGAPPSAHSAQYGSASLPLCLMPSGMPA